MKKQLFLVKIIFYVRNYDLYEREINYHPLLNGGELKELLCYYNGSNSIMNDFYLKSKNI